MYVSMLHIKGNNISTVRANRRVVDQYIYSTASHMEGLLRNEGLLTILLYNTSEAREHFSALQLTKINTCEKKNDY